VVLPQGTIHSVNCSLTGAADMKCHPDNGWRWEDIGGDADESPPAHDNNSVLPADTSPSTEPTHISPTQVV